MSEVIYFLFGLRDLFAILLRESIKTQVFNYNHRFSKEYILEKLSFEQVVRSFR